MGDRYNLKNKLDQIDALKERVKFFEQQGLEHLCSKTNRRIFYNYREVCKEQKMFVNKVTKDDFYRQFISFRKELRESKQSPLFKVFYELYYIAPKSMEVLYKTYKNTRWVNKHAR